jgi:hypothetical protein
VDVIFKTSGDIYMDEEMLRRGVDGDFHVPAHLRVEGDGATR